MYMCVCVYVCVYKGRSKYFRTHPDFRLVTQKFLDHLHRN